MLLEADLYNVDSEPSSLQIMGLFYAIFEYLFMGSSTHCGALESLAAAILKVAGQVMKDAYEKAAQAVAAVWGFTKKHPLFCIAVALGILAILAPWFIHVLGFGALGPIKGTAAACWQSTYAGFVPAGSFFSFFQHLGMVLL